VVLQIEVVLAYPDRVLRRSLTLPEEATVADAITASALEGAAQCPAVAVHGVLAQPQQLLRDGDRVELLRALLADPKDNRRRRARGG